MSENNQDYEDMLRRNTEFQVDTIPQTRGVNGWFTHNANTVTISYKDGYTRMDSLPHEQKHKDNHNAGMYEYPVSPEQLYKLNMYDEISANIASLLELRQKYLETGDISVFDYNKNDNRYAYYKEAIQKGLINPASQYQEDFDKEMRLIANGTYEMWHEKFADFYVDQNYDYASCYGERNGQHSGYYEQNYQRAKKIALTMGGVDFSQYMDKEVEIPQAGKDKLVLLSGADNAELAQKSGFPAYDGSMSLEQYQKLLYHKIVLDKYLNSNSGLNEKEMIDHIALLQVGSTQEAGNGKSACDRACEQTKESYQRVYDSLSEKDKALVTSLVNLAAQDYKRQGKQLPTDNDKAYQSAVQKLYTFNYKAQGDISYDGPINLQKVLDCEEQISQNNKLPSYAQSVQNMSSNERTFRSYMNFMGIPENMIDNSVNNIKNSNKVKKAFIIGCGVIGSPVVGGCTWIKNKLSSNKKKNEKINKIEKDKKPKYREWEDKEGSRVSDVQYEKILDLSKDVIKKPTKSYRAEAKKAAAQKAQATTNQTRPSTSTQQTASQPKKTQTQQASQQTASQPKKTQTQQASQQTKPHNTPNQAVSKEIKDKMISIINYMNKINGKDKAIDANTAVEALVAIYGSDALSLLQTAVNEPSNYAKYVNDSSIKTSRAALQHLCDSADAKKTAQVVKNRQISPDKITKKDEKTAKAPQNQTTSRQDIKSQMRTDTQRSKNNQRNIDEQQKFVHPNDATAVKNPKVFDNTISSGR